MANDTKIPANLRTLYIMEVLSQADAPMTAAQLGHSLKLPKQTIHRLCNTLEEEGFITKSVSTKGYLPARRMRNLSAGISQFSHLHLARHQVLKNLASQVGETINLAIPSDQGMTYIDRVETDWPFRIQLPVGSGVPFHCTASGKLFLGSLPKRQREKVISSLSLEKVTSNTISDSRILKTKAIAAYKNGYATDNEEFIDGMVAIAVPILNEKRNFFGALAFHGPTIRLSIDLAKAKIPLLQKAANQIQDILFNE